MLWLIDVGFSSILGALALVLILGTLVGHFFYGLGTSKKTGRKDAIGELQVVVNAQGDQIKLLKDGLNGSTAAHADCERRVNAITAFNLRLQAREKLYQKTINRLEMKLGVEVTDFTDVSNVPEDPDFR